MTRAEQFLEAAVAFDARKGIGQVPNNIDVDYLGFVKYMTPAQFLDLAAKRPSHPSADWIEDEIKKGVPVGQPFLNVDWNDDLKAWLITNHEGRNRCVAIARVDKNTKVPVHVIPYGLRARHLTSEMKKAPFYSQEDSASIRRTWDTIKDTEKAIEDDPEYKEEGERFIASRKAFLKILKPVTIKGDLE